MSFSEQKATDARRASIRSAEPKQASALRTLRPDYAVEGQDHVLHPPQDMDALALPAPPPAHGHEGPYTRHVGPPLVLYVPGAGGAFKSTGPSPNAFTQLAGMTRRLPRPASSRASIADPESLRRRSDHAWGLDLDNHRTDSPRQPGTAFFGIGR